ncbi:hypothetical protein [Streptoalloteichus hindustanus]|uniref:hypothetical protein n=1 Tax=Streptoalloteichus hindustanus TaxID=2017 RepID=UPI00116153CA|nr:hypothetical protein [Streptoalloteichus hindustanus]
MVKKTVELAPEVITIDTGGGRLAAISEDDVSARYPRAGTLHAVSSSGDDRPVVLHTARALVEVQLHAGGMAPRALVGGQFVAAESGETQFDVALASSSAEPTACNSHLWREPFLAGLTEEFAPALLEGLRIGSEKLGLPAGVLQVDRAGHDVVNSSAHVFRLAGQMLRCVLATKLHGGDVPEEAGRLLRSRRRAGWS